MQARTAWMLLIVAVLAIVALWHARDRDAPLWRLTHSSPTGEARATGTAAAPARTAAGGARLSGTHAESADTSAVIPTQSSGGRFHPRAMSADNRARVDKHLKRLMDPSDPSVAYVLDVEDRLAHEATDPQWTDRMRMDLDDAYAGNPALLHNLEVETQCVATVCSLSAVAPLESTQTPGTDWQAFIYGTFAQPQWRNRVTPKMTTVTGVDGRTVYLTYLERK